MSSLVLLLAFAALGDIAGGRESDVTHEHVALAFCGGWFLFVAIDLLRHRRHVLGVGSLIALGAVLLDVFRAGMRDMPGAWPGASTALGFCWFAFLTLMLFTHLQDRPGRLASPPLGLTSDRP